MPPCPSPRQRRSDHDPSRKTAVAPHRDGDRVARARGESLGHEVGSGRRVVTAHDLPLRRAGGAEDDEVEEGRLPKQRVGVEMVSELLPAVWAPAAAAAEKKEKRRRGRSLIRLRFIGADNRPHGIKIPFMIDAGIRMTREGYTFVLDAENVRTPQGPPGIRRARGARSRRRLPEVPRRGVGREPRGRGGRPRRRVRLGRPPSAQDPPDSRHDDALQRRHLSRAASRRASVLGVRGSSLHFSPASGWNGRGRGEGPTQSPLF